MKELEEIRLCLNGCIGSGKSTSTEIISRDYNVKLIKENYEANPFLEPFYNAIGVGHSGSNWIYKLQDWFLDDYEENSDMIKESDSYVLDSYALAGFTFVQAQFKLGLMGKHETELYNRKWKRFFIKNKGLDAKCKYIVINRTVTDLMSKIKKRDRPYERTMRESFVSAVRSEYLRLPDYAEEFKIDIRVLDVSVSESKEMVANRVIDLYNKMVREN